MWFDVDADDSQTTKKSKGVYTSSNLDCAVLLVYVLIACNVMYYAASSAAAAPAAAPKMVTVISKVWCHAMLSG